MWRAAFNGHSEVVKVLLEAGADPQFRDKVSMESAYDIASNEEVQKFLVSRNYLYCFHFSGFMYCLNHY